MADPGAKKRATYEDVLRAPEHTIAEIIGGELRLSPRPGGPATAVASKLAGELIPPFNNGRGGPGGWIILVEPEIHVADEIVVPDLAGWRLERLPVVPDAPYFTTVPNWTCEVLCRSTERLDRTEKMPVYASIGVEHAWLVHPRLRTLEAFALHGDKWLAIAVHRDEDRARIEPFAALELDLSLLWSNVPLPTKASEAAADYGGF